MVTPNPKGQAAVRQYVEQLLAEHHALRDRFDRLGEEIARLPGLLEQAESDLPAGANPSADQPLGHDPHNLRGRLRILGDIVAPTGEEWDAER